jgi:hypothetical protein
MPPSQWHLRRRILRKLEDAVVLVITLSSDSIVMGVLDQRLVSSNFFSRVPGRVYDDAWKSFRIAS